MQFITVFIMKLDIFLIVKKTSTNCRGRVVESELHRLFLQRVINRRACIYLTVLTKVTIFIPISSNTSIALPLPKGYLARKRAVPAPVSTSSFSMK